jgi:hypothetical protein
VGSGRRLSSGKLDSSYAVVVDKGCVVWLLERVVPGVCKKKKVAPLWRVGQRVEKRIN